MQGFCGISRKNLAFEAARFLSRRFRETLKSAATIENRMFSMVRAALQREQTDEFVCSADTIY